MFYHGTNVGGIKELKPSVSNQGCFVYFSDERFRIIPYLVNPVQKFVDEKCGKGKYKAEWRWALYGNVDDKIMLKEPYPNYIEETFKGQIGYIYYFENIEGLKDLGKPHIWGLDKPIKVENVEVIQNVYDEILKLNKQGKILIKRFEENTAEDNEKYENIVKSGLEMNYPFYKEFLFAKLPKLCKKLTKSKNKK